MNRLGSYRFKKTGKLWVACLECECGPNGQKPCDIPVAAGKKAITLDEGCVMGNLLYIYNAEELRVV